ncbi:MAG: hypothetical protein K0Q63_2699, partial [Paenibacillus sp.]|nr:hypothetical protein [Paenibacillus sp.]
MNRSRLFGMRGTNGGAGKAIRLALAAMLAAGTIPALPAAALHAAGAGTPGGVDASALRLWLKADADNVTLAGDQVAAWLDSSGNGHHLANDGSNAAISGRNRPVYAAANPDLNDQPALKFVRSGSGSILQDADGIFADGEEVGHASVYAVTGGIASIDNSMIFSHSLAGGAFSAHL